MWQDRLEDSEARSARLEATIASLRQDVNSTDRIVLNQPCVYTKNHACFFSVPVFTHKQLGAGVIRMEILQDFADAMGRWLPGGDNDPADCETPWGFELSMSPFGDVWPGHRTKRPISYIDGLVSVFGFAKDMHISLVEIIQSAWSTLIVKPTPLHELCVDTDRSHDAVVEGFIECTPYFLVLQVFLREADSYGCFRNDVTVDNSPVTRPPRWTPNGYDYHDECDEHFRAPGCLKFGPTEWTDAFLEALATNKTRMSNRQSRRKIKEVLDKLGHVPRARAIDYSVDWVSVTVIEKKKKKRGVGVFFVASPLVVWSLCLKLQTVLVFLLCLTMTISNSMFVVLVKQPCHHNTQLTDVKQLHL